MKTIYCQEKMLEFNTFLRGLLEFFFILSHYLCFTFESTYFCGHCVEIVKAAVVTVGWYIANITHRVEIPRSQYEQGSPCTSLKALFLGLPVLVYRCRLQVYQRIAMIYALVFHQFFTV